MAIKLHEVQPSAILSFSRVKFNTKFSLLPVLSQVNTLNAAF